MIAKEWRDARWKFAAAAVLVLLLAFSYFTPYEEIVRVTKESLGYKIESVTLDEGVTAERPTRAPDLPPLPPPLSPEQLALNEMWGFYNVGGPVVLVPLAVLLGAALVSGGVWSGSIYQILSRPVSRVRVLLTKYAVCAGGLLASTLLGGVLLVVVAALRGYPFEGVSFAGIALLGLLMWFASLFVLGVAVLMSAIFRNTIYSLVATALLLLLFFTFPNNALSFGSFFGYFPYYDEGLNALITALSPLHYLVDEGLIRGESFPAAKFLFWMVAAALPLLAALILFRRRSY